jgi:MoaA/NifB/PqqE/SkfB family radical SAM enzyme
MHSEPHTPSMKNHTSPQEIVIHLTLRCPLKCAHCCFSSDMFQEGHLDLTSVLRVIEEAASVPTIERINFVGGDPFLHQDIMEEAFRHASSMGLQCSATTSAYWAPSAEKALKILSSLAESGLSRIILSYDDPHAEFVSEHKIVNAFQAARALNIETYIAVTVEPGAKINREYMERLLGIPPDGIDHVKVYETAINSTGRALEETTKEQINSRRTNELAYRGPCISILRQISIHSDGKLVPCCGVIPFREGLQMGDIFSDSLDASLSQAYDNTIFKWIAFEGPVAILRQITASTANPLRDEDFDGVCNACDVLFSNPEYVQLLTDALPAKEPSLHLQEQIYTSLGLFRPPATASGRTSRKNRELTILMPNSLPVE